MGLLQHRCRHLTATTALHTALKRVQKWRAVLDYIGQTRSAVELAEGNYCHRLIFVEAVEPKVPAGTVVSQYPKPHSKKFPCEEMPFLLAVKDYTPPRSGQAPPGGWNSALDAVGLTKEEAVEYSKGYDYERLGVQLSFVPVSVSPEVGWTGDRPTPPKGHHLEPRGRVNPVLRGGI